MKITILLPLVALTAAGCMAAAYDGESAYDRAPAASLAEAVGDRVAGEPVSCVRMRELEGNKGLDDRTILFEAVGSTVYVNHTRSSCPALKPWRALRFRTTQTQLCSGELAIVFDPTTGVEYGGCSLGEFTPYRRAR